VTYRPPARKLMIMDACVLIDFIKADRSVLELVVKHVGTLHVVGPVIDEVKEIEGENELIELGMVIVEPEIEDLDAASQKNRRTSKPDNLCLLMAKRHGLTCVTNDKPLRTFCEKENVPTMWGLELLIELNRSGGIPAETALDIARKIREANPKHITHEILEQFTELIQKSKD